MVAIGSTFAYAVTSSLYRDFLLGEYTLRMASAIAMAILCNCSAVAAQERWPHFVLPKDAQTFAIGEQLTVNGLPMRLQGFTSRTAPEALVAQFRQSLGKPLVENSIGSKKLLGRAIRGYYLTVQIEPSGKGSKGMMSITNLKGMRDRRDDWKSVNARWMNRLPPGSRIASRMTSEDEGKVATHVVIVNGHSESLNRDALKSMMRDDGFQFEREIEENNKAFFRMPYELQGGSTLLFKGAGKQAMAVIARDAQGRTAIVVNTIAHLENFK